MELKPCPFCNRRLVEALDGWFHHPKGKCILSGEKFHKGYIGQWNKRFDDRGMISANLALAAKIAEAWEKGLFVNTSSSDLHARGWDVGVPFALAYEEYGIDAVVNAECNRIEFTDMMGDPMAIDLSDGTLSRF